MDKYQVFLDTTCKKWVDKNSNGNKSECIRKLIHQQIRAEWSAFQQRGKPAHKKGIKPHKADIPKFIEINPKVGLNSSNPLK